jgi:hypothetical protein
VTRVKLDTYRVRSPHSIQIALPDAETTEAVEHHLNTCAVVEVVRIGALALDKEGPDLRANAIEATIGKAATIEPTGPTRRGDTGHRLICLPADPVTDEERIERSIEWAKQHGRKTNG